MAVLEVDDLTILENGKPVIEELSFNIEPHEQWAIVGPSGSGKTSLLHALAGRHAYRGRVSLHTSQGGGGGRMVLVEQQHRFKNLSNTGSFYYQQRFNSTDSEDAITVEQDILNHLGNDSNQLDITDDRVQQTIGLLRLTRLLNINLIKLSNGENKRLQIAKALLLKPALLLLDKPFIGLDVAARQTLGELLTNISANGVQVILVTGAHDMPQFVTHVLSLQSPGKFSIESAESFRAHSAPAEKIAESRIDEELLASLTSGDHTNDFQYAVQLRNLNIVYDRRKILHDINWEVRRGECWSLSGPNGSGKSTLLSVIFADNPQSYANEVYMFDRRRGSGESIWDIKKRIGFVSPELHLYFETGINCFDVVASGLFDTIGLFRQLHEAQQNLVAKWMKLLRIEGLARKFLFQLSNSEQRLVLLARALVKNPPLLILDEPCQGLDSEQITHFRELVNEICVYTNKTLIYVSHYPEELPACVNRYIRLDEGVAQIG